MKNRTLMADVSPGDRVALAGWIHEKRDLGGIAFLILRDRSGRMQVKFEKDELADDLVSRALSAHRESAIVVTGTAEAEDRAPTGVEVVPDDVTIVSPADPELPLDPSGKVDAELPTRLDHRTLDLRNDAVNAIFRVRSTVQGAIRAYFQSIDCTEITTPKIVATGTEGGTELFPITYFGREAFMNQSPQLFKQLIAGSSLERVFEIGPIFRAEEHNTPRHLNEATSIDFEAAFIDHHDAMDVCEAAIQRVYTDVIEKCTGELGVLEIDLEPPATEFPRIEYEEALDRINATGQLDTVLGWGDDLPTDAEKILGEEVGGFYFITDWPAEIKPFYIQNYDDDPDVSKGFDLMHPRLELVSGGQREHRYSELKAGLEEQGLDPDAFAYYTETFKYGIPPHAGWGLGADRLVMAILELPNIREAVLFPRDRQRLSP